MSEKAAIKDPFSELRLVYVKSNEPSTGEDEHDEPDRDTYYRPFGIPELDLNFNHNLHELERANERLEEELGRWLEEVNNQGQK